VSAKSTEQGMTRRTFLRIGVGAMGALALGGAGVKAAMWAPTPALARDTMGDSMRKVLVTYATKSGSVTDIAERIGAKLAEAGAHVDVKPVQDAPDAAGYDAVILGSGVRVGNWHGAAKSWLTSSANALRSKPVAFFTVGLTITDASKADEVRAYTDPLIKETGVQPTDVGLFAGWFVPKKFSLLERTIMKAMKAPEGDHRDFAAVDAWAAKTAQPLGVVA